MRVLTLLLLIILQANLFGATFTCTSSGDWSNSATWGGSGVPTSSDDVVIKGNATVTVDVSNAVCNNIQLGSNSNPSKGDGTISFSASSQLTSSGAVTFGDGGKNGYIVMTSGGTFITNVWSGKKGSITPGVGKIKFTGNFTLQNSTSFNTFYDLEIDGDVDLAKEITVKNDLILTSGTLDPSQKAVILKGDWINNGGDFDEGSHSNEVVTLSGSSSQNIDSETFHKLTINNSSGINLTGDVTITDDLTFTSGDITLGSYDLIIENSATVSDVSNSSHVVTNGSGSLIKEWTTFSGASFEFPLGDGSNYTPFNLTINTSSPAGINPYISAQLSDAEEPNHSDDDYLTRYWDVSANDLTVTDYDWSASYIQSDVVGTESDIFSYKWDGVSWLEFDQADTTNNEISGSGASGFSSFTGKTGLSALPVELTSFDATLKNDYVLVNWTTGAEINNDYFVVEKSTDGKNFKSLEVVNGSGNSNVSLEYSYIDLNPTSGVNYYRLKQVDFDGTHSYSSVVSVFINSNLSYVLYPNPVNNGVLNVQGDNIISVKVVNTLGEFMGVGFSEDSHVIKINTNSYSAGSYIAVIHSEVGIYYSKFSVR